MLIVGCWLFCSTTSSASPSIHSMSKSVIGLPSHHDHRDLHCILYLLIKALVYPNFSGDLFNYIYSLNRQFHSFPFPYVDSTNFFSLLSPFWLLHVTITEQHISTPPWGRDFLSPSQRIHSHVEGRRKYI